MNDIIIGSGNLDGKGVYANRNFKKGEIVVAYALTPLTNEEFEKIPEAEKNFVHSHWGQLFLYSEPERYVNHSSNPNTLPDLQKKCDIAIRDILKGEEITTDSTKDDVEL
jgi:hypothetical protein